ncbi:MAG: GNAT family N-acetyltransferase [Proteobacteria bacterium]|nr:GNAT family N-acetyltransferase [Pseudomonadota bacterium]
MNTEHRTPNTALSAIRLATEHDRNRWDAYVQTHPEGLGYHRWAWREAVERAYRFECPYLLAEESGDVKGVLPLVYLKPPILRGKLVSLPYCDVGGVLADDAETEGTLVARAMKLAEELGVKGLELRNSSRFNVPSSELNLVMRDPELLTSNPEQVSWNAEHGTLNREPRTANIEPRTPSKVRMVLNLPASSGALLAGFKAKHRSQVRKPERDGLTTRLGGAELLSQFYGIFSENMRDLGSPVHSRDWFSSVVATYGEYCRIGIVYLPDGTPGAGGIILLNGNTVSIPWASSLRRYNRQNPNMLLYWSVLAFAADRGYGRFDFGRSTLGEGTYKFKEQWGARPQPLGWMVLGTKGRGVAMNGSVRPPGSGRRVAEAVIRYLPVTVATILGAKVRRYVSL